MKIPELLPKLEDFANAFIDKLSDDSEQLAKKQIYFLDNQTKLQQTMEALQKIVSYCTNDEEDEVKEYAIKATSLMNSIKNAITNFQNELKIDSDVSEEDTIAKLTEESLENAMKTNKTTQEIVSNMNAIANSKDENKYAIIINTENNTKKEVVIDDFSKENLNVTLNTMANKYGADNLELYKLTPVPVTKKVIEKVVLSVQE